MIVTKMKDFIDVIEGIQMKSSFSYRRVKTTAPEWSITILQANWNDVAETQEHVNI